MPEMLTLCQQPDIAVPLPGDEDVRLRYSPEAVEDVEDFFSLLCFGQNEWAGKPFKLLPWEVNAIRQFYGIQTRDDDGSWVRYRRFLYVEIPKKNGKSEIAAGLGLYHLLFDGESRPQVGIFAADKQNADIIYQCAKYMVEHTDLGQPEGHPVAWCRDSVREIRTKFGGILKVYSSEAKTKHGYSFSAIIVDELHAQPNRQLWDVLVTGSDAARRQQVVIVLTTAGDDPDRKSIGWEIHEKCRRLLNWRQGTPERELDVDDSQWCPIMYGISVMTGDDPDKIAALDITDEALWAACNPSYGVTLKKRQFKDEARGAKSSDQKERLFRWLRLNQWVSTKTVGWLPLTIYDKTQFNQPLSTLAGKTCYGGLDLSKSTDLSSFCLLFPPQEGLDSWVLLFQAWVPLEEMGDRETRDGVPYADWIRAGFLTGCDGPVIDYSQVEQEIIETCAHYNMVTLGMDAALGWTLQQRLMEGGLDVIEIPQTMMGMSPATKEVERLVRTHQLLHQHNTCARWNFGNVRLATDGNENVKPMKNKSTGRIDIAVASIIAMATALVKMNGPGDLASAMDRDDFSL